MDNKSLSKKDGLEPEGRPLGVAMPGLSRAGLKRVWDNSLPSRTELLDAICCPFPLLINPNCDKAQRGSLEWLAQWGVLSNSGLRKAERAQLTTLVAGFYPFCGPRELALASDYVCWAFALDDVGDETPVGSRPTRLLEFFKDFEQTLENRRLRPGASNLARAFENIWNRAREYTTASQLLEFAEGNRAYFGGMLWEANNRCANIVPDEVSYLTFRPAAGAVPSFFALIEPLERISLNASTRDCPELRELAKMAGNIICWTNDLLSYDKERIHGDVHNLVTVFEKHRGLPPPNAAREVVDLVNTVTGEFIALSESLPNFEAPEREKVATYLQVLRSVIRVTLNWTYESTRYSPEST